MELSKCLVGLSADGQNGEVAATRVRFSPHRCFATDEGNRQELFEILAKFLLSQPNLAIYNIDDSLVASLLDARPSLGRHLRCVIDDKGNDSSFASLLPVFTAATAPADIENVFIGGARALDRWRAKQRLSDRPSWRTFDAEVLTEIALENIPAWAWTPTARDEVYPIEVPDIEFGRNLDLILIDCPARNLGLMPNGLGYVHNALKKTSVSFQTKDVDIIIYHRFHIRRLYDEGGEIVLPSGRALPADPWQAEHYDLWSDDELLAYFLPEIDEIAAAVVRAAPKVLALSIHACNDRFSRLVIQKVRAKLSEIVVLVGGFSCYNADIGLRGFPDADYMCIGEADLTVIDVAPRLVRGERPRNIPGVISRWDDPSLPFVPAPMPHNLDLLEFPKYEWFDLSTYRNYNGYQLTPVIASRGCRWSRCTFCAERFYWRIRSPVGFVDELEWLVSQGCHLFMFNESDLNGMPEKLLAICDEIIARGLKVRLTGQLRIQAKADRAFYDRLKKAGFVALRFGVDAFSENGLRLQKKGYTTATVRQNLRDCWEAGIYTEVNWVIGVPGETETDIDEAIDLILECQPYIGRLANINTLILANGGVYWLEPEEHKIHFRRPKEELYQLHPRAIPADMWYSEDPYIDEHVRTAWFERIVVSLHDRGFPVGAWAQRIIDDVKSRRDPARTAFANNELRRAIGESTLSKSTVEQEKSFDEAVRTGANQFRAGSRLGEESLSKIESRVFLARYRDELYAIQPADAVATFGEDSFGLQLENERRHSIPLDEVATVQYAFTKSAKHELVFAVGSYNIVKYDGFVYGIPQSLGRIELRRADPAKTVGVVAARSVEACQRLAERIQGLEQLAAPQAPASGKRQQSDALAIVELSAAEFEETARRHELREKASGAAARSDSELPTFVKRHLGFKLFEFEGWFYGIPPELGDLDLLTEDAVEAPGVIRDVSLAVVEHEIDLMNCQSPSPG